MNTIKIIFLLLNSILIFSVLKWIYKLNISKRYIDKWSKKQLGSNSKQSVHIILPVLDEVKRLEKTVLALENNLNNIKILIVTTEKEYSIINREQVKSSILNCNNKKEILAIIHKVSDHFIFDFKKLKLDIELGVCKKSAIELIDNCYDTIDLANQLKEKFNNIDVYHYKGSGNMSAQVNYGIKCFMEGHKRENPLFALYNADSVINQKTIDWVLTVSEKNRNKSILFQQYGHYLPNPERLANKSKFESKILLAAGLWQTRWSLGYEMANAIEQFQENNPVLDNYILQKRKPIKFNYCIGHGLYFTYDVIKKMNWLSEKTHNEDMMFGIQACSNNIPIIPIPFLENSESPNSIKALIIQKSTWYFGPFEAFKYYNIIKKDPLYGSPKNLLLYACLLFENSIRWVLMPIIVFFILIMGLIWFPLYYLMCLMLIFLYLPFLNWLSNRQYDNKQILFMFIPTLLCFLFHLLSALRAIKKMILRNVFNVSYKKERTPLN